MVKTKKKFNWRARQQPEPGAGEQGGDTPDVRAVVEGLVTGQDAGGYQQQGENDSNILVLPSTKSEKTKQKQKEPEPPAKLSKKKRKFLQNILDRKKKKAKRSELLEALQECAVTQDEVSMLHSTSRLGQKLRPIKRTIEQSEGVSANCIKGSNKRARTARNHGNSTQTAEVTGSDSTDTDDISTDEGEDEPTVVTPVECDPPQTSDPVSPSHETTDEPGVREGEDVAVTTETEVREEKLSEDLRRPAVFVPVDRTPEIQAARLCLPILGEEQAVMEAINNNPVTVICGETGSGKTTQVPQFLYEAGYARNGRLIGVTEPRRVAAVSMSQRIGLEMNLTKCVSYQIRYEGNVTDQTKIKLMTDGVLLKEIQNDFLLSKYSVIVIDEAHERSVYTDIIIGLLSRIIPLRNKRGSTLRMVIMSATLRVEDFTENVRLFKTPPPVVEVDARQHPVTVHFNRRTHDDYLTEAYRKVCKIHRTLPEGGILIFVTGQQEVNGLCRKLRSTFPKQAPGPAEVKVTVDDPGGHDDSDSDEEALLRSLPRKKVKKTETNVSKKFEIDLDSYSSQPLEDTEADLADDEIDEEFDLHSDIDDLDDDGLMCEGRVPLAVPPLHVLPLYSLLSSKQQGKVFTVPPGEQRLCVVATNVAETSLTIPGVKYVVDCGKVKKRFYDKMTGISSFVITRISKASANQRAGRAGRTGPGHCYRLYSSAVFQEFEEFPPAEVTRRPVEDLVLQMKDLNIDKVVNFPFPTPPSKESIIAAERILTMLGAIQTPQDVKKPRFSKQLPCSGKITELGRAMAAFPLSPRFSKMICLSLQHNLLPYIITIVSALTVQEIFTDSAGGGESSHKAAEVRRTWAGVGVNLTLGDLMVLLKAVGACEYSGCADKFCQQFCLRPKAMQEIRKLRGQLITAVNSVYPEANAYIDDKMTPPTSSQVPLIRQIVLAGLCDKIARRIPTSPQSDPSLKHAYKSQQVDDPVFIHPSSVLFKQLPEYLIYHEIVETSKLYMKCVIAVEPEWLPVFASSLCSFSKPLDDPRPSYNQTDGSVMCHMNVTYGSSLWSVPCQVYKYPESLTRYRWFASFLLDGQVFTQLKIFTPTLLSPPSTMVKSWARLQSRTEHLLKALVSEKADSRQALTNVWKTNKKFLLDEYCEWVDKSKHEQLLLIWPPIK